MQRRPLFHQTLRAGALLVALSLAMAARAAELGDIAVRSYIGQQLSADIELVALTPEEMNSLPVRLAPVDVYRGANVTMDPVLAGLRLGVVRREQRSYLHITTLQPVDAGYVHLFLELGSGEHQVVRLATIWLAADPHPVPPPQPVVMPPAAIPAPPAVALPALPKPMPAAVPAAADPALLAAMARAAQPTPALRPPEAPHRAARLPLMQPEASHTACAPQAARMSSKECVALDTHSAALSHQLVRLEEQVKQLQSALDGKRPASAAPPSPASASAAIASIPAKVAASPSDHLTASPAASLAASRPHPALPKLKWREKKEKPVEHASSMTTWIAVAGAGLLLAGLGFYLWRKRRARSGGGPLTIWQGWRKKGGTAAAPAEPAMEAALEPE